MRYLLAACLFFSITAQAELIDDDEAYRLCSPATGTALTECRQRLTTWEQDLQRQAEANRNRREREMAEHNHLIDGLKTGRPLRVIQQEIESEFYGQCTD